MSGWKTISAGIITIAYGIVVQGIYNQNWTTALELVLAGLAILGLGHKLDKLKKEIR